MKLRNTYLEILYWFKTSITGFMQYRSVQQAAKVFLTMCICVAPFALADTSTADTFYVDGCANGSGEGSQTQPFYTLNEAVVVAAQDNIIDDIIVQRGAYPESHVISKRSFTISTPLTITAANGPVIIGQHGNLVKTVRLLTHNVVTKGEYCDERAKWFGEEVARAVPRYDIVALQEFFHNEFLFTGINISSCDKKHLIGGITSRGDYQIPYTHPILGSTAYVTNGYLFRPDVSFDEPGDLDGGVGTFTLHSFIEVEDWEWDEAVLACMRQGFTFTRIPITDTEVTLDIYNVHLCGEASQEALRDELEQLADTISEYSSTSGNPVIVMGDFNIDGPLAVSITPGTLYMDIMDILKNPRDLWLETHPDLLAGRRKLGITKDDCGKTVSLPSDLYGCQPLVGSPSDCVCNGERLDYIFVITHPQFKNSRYTLRIGPDSNVNYEGDDNVRVVRWFIEQSTLRVSDHFGLEATIEIHDCR